MKIASYKIFKNKLLKDRVIRAEYDRLKPEIEIVKAIIAKRIEKGFSQNELAKRAHTTQSAIARLESGSYNPTIALLRKVSEALESSLRVSFE